MTELSPGARELREILGNLLDEKLKPLRASIDIAIEQGKSNTKTMGQISRRLESIEKHVGMNGSRFVDTEPAPATEPENPKPEELG